MDLFNSTLIILFPYFAKVLEVEINLFEITCIFKWSTKLAVFKCQHLKELARRLIKNQILGYYIQRF